jgi:hypothetical protein
VLGDTAYGLGPVRAELAAREVEVLAPLPPGATRAGRLGKRDFGIDLAAGTVRCSADALAPIRTGPAGARRARFRRSDCAPCALRDRCVEPANGVKTIAIEPHEALLIAARQALPRHAGLLHLVGFPADLNALRRLWSHAEDSLAPAVELRGADDHVVDLEGETGQ